FRVGKEAFTDPQQGVKVELPRFSRVKGPSRVADVTAVTADAPVANAAITKSVKASLRDPESLKAAFTDLT
ncbi:hypothetical protein ACFWMR_28840, partial [Amycolatopsis thailandensis]|uniref:hypothetical protein n=1 Tax=Amycolatopsis thailandensis TaxID=589330 RepID=UPI0036563038